MSKTPYEKLSRLKRDYPNILGRIRANMDGATLVKKGFRFISLEDTLLSRSFFPDNKDFTVVYGKVLDSKPGRPGYESRYRILSVD